MEQFIVRYANNVISVCSLIDGLADITKRLISPPFHIQRGTDERATWEIEVKVASPEWKAARNEQIRKDSVILAIAPTEMEYVISDYSQEMIRLYTPPSLTMGLLAIESKPKNRSWTLYLESEKEKNLRWLSRIVRLYFGSLLQNLGYKFVHASAVSIKGKGVFFVGDTGHGKSSLMYLACSRLGASFLSDDLVGLWTDENEQLQAIGWPKRIALGLSLLKNEQAFEKVKSANLRRTGLEYSLPQGQLSEEWSKTNRVAFDIDEFLNLFGFDSVSISTPALIVFTNANQEMSGWNVQKVADDKADILLKANFADNIALKYMTDYLGLANYDLKSQKNSHIEKLMVLPKVKVSFGHSIRIQFNEFWEEILNFAEFYP